MNSPTASESRSESKSESVPRLSPWKRRLFAVAFGVVASFAMLLLAELGVRIFCPFVQLQGTAKELYRWDEGGPDWTPGASGISFGAVCNIDEVGCRVVGTPDAPEKSWLVLGDSVAFGVGVEGPKTFSGVYQTQHPGVRVLNSGVCGAGSKDQLRVTRRMLNSIDPPIDRISLFYVLNDIGDIKFEQEKLSTQERLLHPENRSGIVMKLVSLVRTRSKLYVMAKGILTDPPTRYFNWELQKYRQWNPETPGDVEGIVEIAELAAEKDIAFDVFIFPYVGQYASTFDDAWLPQERIGEYLRSNSINVVDTRSWFEGDDMKRNFLFADGCHFSERGHQLVCDMVSQQFIAAGDANSEPTSEPASE